MYNLYKSYRYQTLGYYVSLLAEARGHKPLPRVNTIEDLPSQNMVRLLTEDLDELLQKSLEPVKPDTFELDIYFGHSTARRYEQLSRQLFKLLHAPLLRANFQRHGTHWRIHSFRSISASDIPPQQQKFAVQATTEYFTGRKPRSRKLATRYNLAIPNDPDSIIKCNNKVYLAETLARHHIPMPKTMLVQRDNVKQIISEIGLPCVLKQPDSSFSIGVVKAETEEELTSQVDALLDKSELIGDGF